LRPPPLHQGKICKLSSFRAKRSSLVHQLLSALEPPSRNLDALLRIEILEGSSTINVSPILE
jgi:hypothetical protein